MCIYLANERYNFLLTVFALLGYDVWSLRTFWCAGWWENNKMININIEVLCVGYLHSMDKK